MKTIHFVSGLPRSCSTLLMQLLAQNPRVHSTPTSAVYDLAEHARKGIECVTAKATSPVVMQGIASDFVRGGIIHAYDSATERPVIAEKSRAWCMSPDLLFHLFPNAKLIIPVRDIRGIVSSLEKKHRESPVRFAPGEDANWITLNGRVQGWLNSGPVPAALQGIHETATRFRNRVLFVHAEELTTKPAETMAKVWAYLGEDFTAHDFTNVAQYTQEIDVGWPYGDHTIRGAVTPLHPDWNDVLGRDVSETLRQKFDWINSL